MREYRIKIAVSVLAILIVVALTVLVCFGYQNGGYLVLENQTAAVTPAPETVETVGVSETIFVQRMDSLENLLLGSIVCSALIVSALLATLTMRFWHVW